MNRFTKIKFKNAILGHLWVRHYKDKLMYSYVEPYSSCYLKIGNNKYDDICFKTFKEAEDFIDNWVMHEMLEQSAIQHGITLDI